MSLAPREYIFGKECREKVFEGIALMYKVVGSTLGPWGRNVAIDRHQVVQQSKDGVTVAEEVKVTNRWQEIGVKLVKEASQNTNLSAGDATTSAVILSYEMCNAARDLPTTANVIKVKKGIEKAITACLETLTKMSKEVKTEEEFTKVARIASQDEEIAKIVTDAFMKAGKYGSIEIERAEEPGITVEKTEGISFNKGYILPYVINDFQKKRAVMEDCAVLVTDREIKNQNQLVSIMEKLAEQKIFKLLIVAEDVKGDALGMIAANLQKKAFFATPVRAPSFGNDKIAILNDICAATGATLISEEQGGMRLERANVSHLGKCKKAIVTQDKTIIMIDDTIMAKKTLSDRIEFIKNQLDAEPKDTLDHALIEKRLATLTDGICVLKVGAQTEVERHERKDRVQDAVCALRSASEEGVTPGGGVGLLRCVGSLVGLTEDRDELLGVEIVKKALHSIALKILEVAYIEDREWIVGKIKEEKGWMGYDFETGKIVDLYKKGIWDAAKAVKCALKNAAAVAQSFVATEVAMTDVRESDTILAELGQMLLPRQ